MTDLVQTTPAEAEAAGWRMPLWPLPPLLVIGAVGYALLGTAPVDLLVTGGILAVALAYYVLYLARRPGDRFIVVDPTEDDLHEPVPIG